MTRDERTAALEVWSIVLGLINSGTPVLGIDVIARGMMEPLADPILEEHREAGFDEVSYDPEDNTFAMKCSRCAVVIINDVACHEHGCPNKSRRNT